jgi:hypothetical protein
MLRILIVLIFLSNVALGQTNFEFRNFYTNEPLKNGNVFINNQRIKLDSLGQLTYENFKDSLFIHFGDKYAYKTLILVKNLQENKLYTIYQFDKYRSMSSHKYVLQKSWFGLRKRYTHEGMPDEEYNKYDIFLNRDNLKIIQVEVIYNYFVNDEYREYINLEIET